MCRCNYREDQKNQKILVGYGSLAETSVLFTITPISSQQKELAMTCSRPLHLCDENKRLDLKFSRSMPTVKRNANYGRIRALDFVEKFVDEKLQRLELVSPDILERITTTVSRDKRLSTRRWR